MVGSHLSLGSKESEPAQSKPLAETITPLVQREEEEESQEKPLIQREEEEKEEGAQTKPLIRRQEGSSGRRTASSHFESRVSAAKGSGQPLSESTRSFFEPRFGTDFSSVRVHTDSTAAQGARSINAKAFTTGSNIFFNSGYYSPGTSTGKDLLAHELTHTIQQGGANVLHRTIDGPFVLSKAPPHLAKDMINRANEHPKEGSGKSPEEENLDTPNDDIWPKGTKEDPIPIKWYKKSDIYPTINGKTLEEGVTLPQTEKYNKLELEVSEDNIKMKDKIIKRRPRPKHEDKKQEIYERLNLEKKKPGGLGVSIDKYSIDHVRDLTWRGEDEYDNLWPLDTKKNLAANASHNQYVKAWYRQGVICKVARSWSGKFFIVKEVVPLDASRGNEKQPVNSKGRDL